jgi:hypothetical protein
MAWEEMYAAEGSDWFWWYGGDQGAPGGDEPFDKAYITHLKNVQEFAEKYGVEIEKHPFEPIMLPPAERIGKGEEVEVVFECDRGAKDVPDALYIVGDKDELANWTPNKVKMYDDGTHGDRTAEDGIWSLSLRFPAGTLIEYKYTNSGEEGVWSPSEEFPVTNRQLVVSDPQGGGRQVVEDKFGVIE